MALIACGGRADSFAATNASPDVSAAAQRLRLAPGLRVRPWASEPLIQNITSVSYDSRGRAYVVESGRRRTSVFDVRGLGPWLEDDFSFRTESDRADFLRRVLTPTNSAYPAFLEAVNKGGKGGFQDFNRDGVLDWHDLEVEAERIRRVTDIDGDGTADAAETFADGFNGLTTGVAAGVLAEGTNVWFACIPDIWKLPVSDEWRVTGDKASPPRNVEPRPPSPATRHPLLTGFGVHIAFGGHDLHGLIKGPDGRIYFTIADRGTCVTSREGKVISLPDTGAVFRCEPDGSNFEVFAQGLRNPQELAFDALGNLWTADNNGDGGDKARWTLVLEGADYGWTIGWQWLPKMGAWNSERLWHTRESNTAAYLVPPVAHIGHGPAGIAYYPGTGLGDRFKDHFFYADFPGGVRHFRVEPDGAFFKVVPADGAGDSWKWMEDNSAANLTGKILWELSPVDVTFPPFGGLIVADWVQGWEKTGKGRLWHVTDPTLAADPQIAEVRRLLAEGMGKRREKELLALLGHRDQRVRLEAQWELAGRGPTSFDGLKKVAFKEKNLLARIHALWGIEQLARAQSPTQFIKELMAMMPLLRDETDAVRIETARVLGEARLANANNALVERLGDSSAQVRAASVLALEKISHFIAGRRYAESIRESAGRMTHELLRGADSETAQSVRQHLDQKVVANLIDFKVPLVELVATNAAIDPLLLQRAVMAFSAREGQAAIPMAWANGYLKGWPGAANLRLISALAARKTGYAYVESELLRDPSPQVVLEAARAINDVPIREAMPALAALVRPGALDQVQWPAQAGGDALNFTRDEWRTWVLRRAVNAAFRLGGETNATALAEFAARSDAPESVRVEALEDLADWAQPPKRDKIVGLHRPLEPRDPQGARTALASVWPRLAGGDVAPPVLTTALKSGAALAVPGLAESAAALSAHRDDGVQAELLRIREASGMTTVDDLIGRLGKGPVASQQMAFARLGSKPDTKAAAPLAEWVAKLTAGKVVAELQADVLEAALKVAKAVSAPGGNTATNWGVKLAASLGAWTNSLPKDDPLAPHRISLAGGDGANGRRLFAERADWGCLRCHKLKGEGGDVGPDLTGMGRAKGREYVLRAILNPNSEIAPGYETVLLELKDDTTVVGVLRGDTAEEFTLMTAENGRMAVRKADVKSKASALSAMPEGLADLMAPRELRDVIEALSQ